MNTLRKAVAGLALLAATGPFAHAGDPVQYNLDTLFNGTAPSGSTPWVTATFSDWATDTVKLTLSTSVNSGSYISRLFFNYTGTAADLAALTFSALTGGSYVAASDIKRSVDGWQADGDGKYDLRLDFADASFYTGKSAVYTIGGVSGLSAQSFKDQAAPGGPKGPFYAAALSGPTGGWLSAPVAAIPEPETYAMMLAGLGLMGWMARRRRKSLEVEPA